MNDKNKFKITVVYDNEALVEGLEADWGFSCFIEGNGTSKVLFDSGSRGTILLNNLELLGIDPASIEFIIISHGHTDHTGGLAAIVDLAKNATLCVPSTLHLGFPAKNVIKVKGPVQIRYGIYSTGVLDGIEQALVLSGATGIYVIAGCSHPGVGKILNAASRFGHVEGIIGGFHGFNDFGKLNNLSIVCPCHCTQYKKEIAHIFPGKFIKCGTGLVIEL
jgi:7,8-dihydropterin-6-yl-methyl-4-(beta-D-ribofuranosyl)aminobenzene 5'-phosphate synthase